MSLQAGTSVGPYRIVAPLGAGGMGEVYRAHDTRLKRDVAVKVLPAEFARDADRLARFEREAELLASLNHTNIAGIYGLETSDGTSAIILELVEGETLADQIARGPIPVSDALPIARQIAEALEAAHDKGIIHRDLKPANIKITPDGRAKVLDFGLAKLLEPTGAPAAGVSGFANSPTLSVHATYAGTILGTAAYMSPEQARGKKVDQRTDVWAFGCVLFEMLTGAPPFDTGETVSDAIAAILKNEPRWDSLPADTPTPIRGLLKRCLQKDPQKRLPHIGVARLEIDEVRAGRDETVGEAVKSAERSSPRTARWPAVLLGLLIGIGVAVAGAALLPWSRQTPQGTHGVVRLDANLGGGISLAPGSQNRIGPSFVLSPDGTALVFAGQPGSQPIQLYVRRLEQLESSPLAGTNNALAPFFSPNGEWVAFFADGKLKKIPLAGGLTVTIADAPDHRGGTWLEDDTIVFATTPTAALSRVSSNGGPIEPFTRLVEHEVTHRWPHALPGDRAVLYEAHTSRTAHDEGTIVVEALSDHARKVVHRGGYDPKFIRSGHVTLAHQGTLFAVPFDATRLEGTGEPRPVLEGVSANTTSGWADASASHTGTLAYLPGSVATSGATIEWIDRKGQSTPLRPTPLNWNFPSFSGDGAGLALQVVDGQADIWIHDVDREGMARLTSNPANDIRPIWTPDGRRVTFGSNRDSPTGTVNLFWQPVDVSAEAERLTTSTNIQNSGSWHPNGRLLAFTEIRGTSLNDIMILPLEGSESSGWKPGTPTAFVATPFIDIDPVFSPDGRWLAYASTESGVLEVYVRPFPGPGGRIPVSIGGGFYPAWSRSRPELLYSVGDGRIMVVNYTVQGDVFRVDKPRPWTDVRLAQRLGGFRNFALHPDGDRIAAATAPGTDTSDQREAVVFIFNFFDELRRLTTARD